MKKSRYVEGLEGTRAIVDINEVRDKYLRASRRAHQTPLSGAALDAELVAAADRYIAQGFFPVNVPGRPETKRTV